MAKATTEGTDQTRDIPPLSLRAQVSPGTLNDEARTVELVWTTGARVLRGFWEPYWEELSLDPKHVRMARLNNGAPFLDSHDMGAGAEAVLGVVESARLEKDQGVAVVRFAKDDPAADAVWNKIRQGILQNVSVGYRVYKLVKTEEATDKVPVVRVEDWEPYELSVVPAGADDGAGFRNAAQTRSAPNPCTFVTPQRKEPEAMANENNNTVTPPVAPPLSPIESATRAAAQARINEETAKAQVTAQAVEAARQSERDRSTTIRQLVRRAKLGDDLADKFITDGADVDDVRAVILDHIASDGERSTTVQHLGISAGEDAREKFVRGASAWMFERLGLTDLLQRAAKADPVRFRDVAFDGAEFRGMTLPELARESLERRGVKTRGMSRNDMIGMAFVHRAAGYQSQSDFAVLLENTMNKSLLGEYAITPDTWSRFCKVETVSDFRASNRYRTGSLTVLDAVGEGGEFKQKVIPDGQKLSISTATKGNIVGLNRQTIINDDLGALTNQARQLGRAARNTIETDVYALLALNSGLGPTQGDSQPFFHSNRSNVNGTGSAISVAGVDADAIVMSKQKDPNGVDFLDLQPYALVVARDLKGTANEINDAQFDFDNAGTNTTGKFQRPNRCRGLFKEVVGTPRLSGTRRYLFADPSIAPAIVVAFLEGQGQGPFLDSENGFRVDGVEWKVRLDMKAQMFDPKGAVTNAGA